MRVLIAIAGAVLVVLMLAEFFVTFMLPRRVRREAGLARELDWLLWRCWRVIGRRLDPTRADALLGIFGPMALLLLLVIWGLGSMIGFGLIEWALAGGSFSTRFLASSDLFFGDVSSGSVGVRVVELLEVATGIGVLFIVIGYMPAVYSAFSVRETAVSQLAARAGSPPTASTLLQRASRRGTWLQLASDLRSWEKWAAELMETHLTYPLLSFYRSQHVDQNWLAALTAMVDVAAFLKATMRDEHTDAADITFRIGTHALADMAYQFRLDPIPVDRLSKSDFDRLFAIVERSPLPNLGRTSSRRRLDRYRGEYEANAQALADALSLELPPWVRRDGDEPKSEESRMSPNGAVVDLVGQSTGRRRRRRVQTRSN
jgi:hypothetical protein